MTVREISPLDGRYREQLSELPDVFSEFALMRERCRVELDYLEALDSTGLFAPLTADERERIEWVREGFDDDAFARIKEIEAETNHDVKACEILLRERLGLANPNLLHFGLTSEDVNNLAYGRLLDRYRTKIQLPQMHQLISLLADLSDRWSSAVFPARTHGQPASPTTFGKELAVFLSRLLRQAETLEAFRFRGKLAGATGTHAACFVSFPAYDWRGFSKQFVESLGLLPNPCTTQIEDHDTLAEYFAIVSRINGIVVDLDTDLWLYISHGYILQKAVAGEVGSSTMPHKVNPIRFENSEGNITIANALLFAMAEKLTRSRMQRDLSDMTVRRNIGVALAHGYLAIEQTMKGLARIDLNHGVLRAVVANTPEVLAEAYQTVLRAAGVENPYELLRNLTRGETVALENLHAWIDRLGVPGDVAERLKSLRPVEYIGLAPEICMDVVDRARAWLDGSV